MPVYTMYTNLRRNWMLIVERHFKAVCTCSYDDVCMYLGQTSLTFDQCPN